MAASRLRILAILPSLDYYGGVISVVNLLEELLELGHVCHLGLLNPLARRALRGRLEPFWIRNTNQVSHYFAHHGLDIVLVTAFDTVKTGLRLARAAGAIPVYFVQDYEVDFISPLDKKGRDYARATYDWVETKVVKTAYLQDRLRREGLESTRIRPGMNLHLFYPRPHERSGRFSVLAMARPFASQDQRGFSVVKAAFEKLAACVDDIELGLFGHDFSKGPELPFPFRDFGVCTPWQLPDVYSWADVYLDASRFHGFGRTGIEAMACGTACVLTRSGGISEYARHGENAWITDLGSVDGIVEAVRCLRRDSHLLDKLKREGRVTASQYGESRAAEDMVEVFRNGIRSAESRGWSETGSED